MRSIFFGRCNEIIVFIVNIHQQQMIPYMLNEKLNELKDKYHYLNSI